MLLFYCSVPVPPLLLTVATYTHRLLAKGLLTYLDKVTRLILWRKVHMCTCSPAGWQQHSLVGTQQHPQRGLLTVYSLYSNTQVPFRYLQVRICNLNCAWVSKCMKPRPNARRWRHENTGYIYCLQTDPHATESWPGYCKLMGHSCRVMHELMDKGDMVYNCIYLGILRGHI